MFDREITWNREVKVPRCPVGESDPRAAVHAVERHRRGRFVVFLISDFIDHDVPEDLKYVRARHDVSLLHVYDPFEYATGAPVVFQGFSPEGGRRRGRRPMFNDATPATRP